MNVGLIISILSLLLVILISFIYFSKNRLNVFENNIFSTILRVTLIGFTINTFTFIIDIYFTQFLELRLFLLKLYYLYLFTFVALLTSYLLNITIGDSHKKSILLTYLVAALFTFVLPFDSVIVDNQIEVSGIGVVFTYCVYGITIFYWIIHLIFNYNKIEDKKKLLPLVLYSVFSGPMLLIQYFFSDLFLEPFLIAYVLIFMYHTIENPDAKILEELHMSKEISDSANEEKTMFLFNMTQEIRNITNSINDDADVILDSKELDSIYDSARNIKLNTTKFMKMTNDILDVSNIDSSTLKVYNSKYNIKTILKEIVNVYNGLSKKNGLNFITNIDHDIPEVLYGDSIGLKEILNTVLDNSIKYTSKGFIELSVNTIIKNDICRLIITIEDSGAGIKSDNIDKIKIDNTSLAKANKLITVMNGTMLISSDYGIGTKVKLILDQKMAVRENKEIAKYEATFDNTSVLCVDDSEAGLKILEKLLKNTKIKLSFANTGKECLDMIKINKYDLIFLDEDLTQITGIELMNKIKEIRNFKTPVILLTKDTSFEYNDELSKIGFCDHVLKPVKKEILIEKIEKYTKKDMK